MHHPPETSPFAWVRKEWGSWATVRRRIPALLFSCSSLIPSTQDMPRFRKSGVEFGRKFLRNQCACMDERAGRDYVMYPCEADPRAKWGLGFKHPARSLSVFRILIVGGQRSGATTITARRKASHPCARDGCASSFANLTPVPQESRNVPIQR